MLKFVKKNMFVLLIILFVCMNSFASNDRDTLIIGVSHTPPTIDQDICLDPISFYILCCIQEQGVDYPQPISEEPGAKGIRTLNFSGEWEIIPRLFESWEQSADGKTTTFHIRKGSKSAYGNEFTSKDFLWRYERGKEIQGFGATYMRVQGTNYELLKANVVDKYTVKIVSEEPNGLQVLMAGNLTNGFWDSTECMKHATPEDPWVREWMQHNAAHFGPYYIKEWKAGDYVLLERNPNYWGVKPKIDKIMFKVIPESSSRLAMIKKGEIDIALELTPREVESLEGAPGVESIKVKKTGWIRFLTLNQKEFEPFKNKKVRQALNYAIPREEIINTVFYDAAIAMYSPIKQEYPGALPAEYFPYKYNLEKAKQLLEEAGYPNGFDIELWYEADRPLDESMVILIQNSFGKIGVDVELRKAPSAPFYSNVQSRLVSMALLGDIPFTPDANYAYNLNFHSEAFGNYSNYVSEEADRLAAIGKTIVEMDKRIEHHYDLQKLLLEDAPVGFIVQAGFRCAIRTELKGFNTYIGDNIKAEYLYFDEK